MLIVDRQTILHYLTDNWGSYVTDYRSMTPQAQQQFLRRQGYRRFADLLSHCIAWWDSGMRVIETYRVDPDYESPPVDVDAFNAAAVAKAQDMSEEQVVRCFEVTRDKFFQLVNRLTDEDFKDAHIIRQLEMELIGHLAEHAIKNDPDP